MKRSGEFFKSGSVRQQAVDVLAVALLYFSLAQLGFLFAIPPGNITIIWLPSGLAMAAILALGAHAAVGVLTGAFLANYFNLVVGTQAEMAFFPSLLIACFNTAEGLVAARMLPRSFSMENPKLRMKSVLPFVGGAFMCGLVAAVPGAFVMQEPGSGTYGLLERLFTWWLGDSLGIITGFPLVYKGYRAFFFGRKPDYFLNQMTVTAIGLLLSILSYIFTLNVQTESLRLRFNYVSEVAFLSLENAVREIFQHQASIASQIELEPDLGSDRFRVLTRDVVQGEYRALGLQALSWNPIVRGEDRDDFERQTRLRGQENFQITELDANGRRVRSVERDRYVTVLYIEPYETNQSAVGYDIFSEPLRREAIERAIRTNAPAATSPIQLVQGGNGEGSIGALVPRPVWRASETRELERQLIGFVVAVVNFSNLLNDTSSALIADARVSMSDVTDFGAPVTIYSNFRSAASEDSGLGGGVAGLGRTRTLEIAGRNYLIESEPADRFLIANASPIPGTVLITSLLLTLLASLLYLQWLRTLAMREDAQIRTSQIIDCASDAIIAIDNKGFVTEWSKAAVQMFGYEERDTLGKPLVELIIPEQFAVAHALAMSNYSSERESRVVNKISEMSARRANGEIFTVELSVRPVFLRGKHEFIGLIRDVTERQRAEVRLRESQKLDAIGQLTGGLAHDFNNLLGIVINNLDYLNANGLNEVSQRHVKDALDAAVRASKVTKSLMSVARRQAMDVGVFDINAELAELKPLMENTIGKTVHFELKLAKGCLASKFDTSGFNNAIVNLVINARDAVRESPVRCVTVATTTETLEVGADELAPGKYAVVSVSDTGPGMSPEILARVFEPFFTTKERGLGTGLGLPMAYGFARQLHGKVTIETREQQGTCVKLYLPLAGVDRQSLIGSTVVPRSAVGGTAPVSRVLVVEDELFLRKVACRLFSDLGHTVIEADSADAAVLILQDSNVDILFTDIAMPGTLNGIALAKHVSEKYPGIKVIITTGFLDEKSRQSLLPSWRILDKPYRKASLVELMCGLL
ncbi:MAG: hypothetical protein A3H44_03230 [Gammaproteobacteria bacterium RIFCSPLOWO2_02_FULL_57_10]|nr:MAG: hypothetical protein A3H44_03230 [Gammaproteobacteria bacterium RIFCSPLOWO2_02_FULL_57_10]